MEPFSELSSWRSIGAHWTQLFGGFATHGFSFEWHDFELRQPFAWNRTFHPDSIELCLNLAGEGLLGNGDARQLFGPGSALIYATSGRAITAARSPGMRHRFLTVEFARSFLERHLPEPRQGIHPVIDAFLEKVPAPKVAAVQPLSAVQAELPAMLQAPPVAGPAQAPWFLAKALELVAAFFFAEQTREPLFCERQLVLARERVEKACALLREHLAEPPPLEEIGRKVGCSHFYLSRMFRKVKGVTLSQYLRQIRMERAAELLKSGKFNVTQAAFEVGYSSLSHFSQTFHETFGCCPGLYPLKLPR